MASRQEIRESEKSMSSTLLEVVGPALIMLMVGSLVFFLIEVFYRGPHTARLCWVFGLFTFAAVLVSRVSIESGKERGLLFGWALGLAAFVTSFTLVQFEGSLAIVFKPFILAGFIGVVMWSASKLTWDCTVIDKSRDTSATGITELVRRKFNRDTRSSSEEAESNETVEINEASDAQAGNLIKAFFTRGERKNTPGIWVFYFAMAALPIFGLGQWFVTPDHNNGYFWVVFLFGVYLSSALALMMTTSLLGLQRYLRKRKTYMPPEIARTWLGLGIVVAIVVLAAVMLFPRPNATNSIANGLKWFTSPNRESFEFALGSDGTEEKQSGNSQQSSEEGKQSSANAETNQTSGESNNAKKTQGGGKGKGGNSAGSSGNSQNGGDKKSNHSEGQKSGQESSSQNKSGDNQGGSSGGKGGEKQSSESTGGEANEREQADSKGNEQGKESDQGSPRKSKIPDHMRPDKSAEQKRRNEAEAERRKEEQQRNSQSNSSENRQNEKRDSNNASQNSSSTPRTPKPNPPSLEWLNQIASLITYLVVGVAFAVLCVLFRKEIMAAIRGMIAELQKLFGDKRDEPDSEDLLPQPAATKKVELPFSHYSNPFTSGRVEKMKPEEVVAYTFSALEAWARERGIDRHPDQTPHEFASTLGRLDAKVGQAAGRLSHLLGKSLFGKRKIESAEVMALKDLWDLMQNAVPISSTPIAFAN